MTSLPDEPTPGETKIILGTILETLKEVKKDMATREFVEGKFGSFSDRVTRLEEDMKRINSDNTKAIDKLSQVITDKIQKVVEDFDEEASYLNKRIDVIVSESSEQMKSLRDYRRSRSTALLIAGLSAFLSIIGAIVTATITQSFLP